MLHLQQLLLDQLTREQILNIVKEQAEQIELFEQSEEKKQEDISILVKSLRTEKERADKLQRRNKYLLNRKATLFNYVMLLDKSKKEDTRTFSDSFTIEAVENILSEESFNIDRCNQEKEKV